MPRLSVWFVRASLVYLAIGFSIGALIQANKGLAFYQPVWRLLPVHYETLLMGWFIQLAMGVAFWILPRFSASPRPRGNEQMIWLAFWLVNLGIILTFLDVLTSLAGLILAGRIVELAGVVAFVAGSWKRVKNFGK